MNIVQPISALLIGYLFGCFQTSYFISKKFGDKDIREMGSGNAGASNVTSEMGWKFGIPTGISDVLKSYFPIQLVLLIFPVSSYQQVELMAITGMGVILGHIYPFFMNFEIPQKELQMLPLHPGHANPTRKRLPRAAPAPRAPRAGLTRPDHSRDTRTSRRCPGHPNSSRSIPQTLRYRPTTATADLCRVKIV